MSDDFLLVEKYRPKTLEDCILPESLQSVFDECVNKKDIPNFLFSGSSGIGKTTVAKALCHEINAEWMLINGSEESGIDVLRTKIKTFASSVSLTGEKKVVILDESDYLNPNSTQPALRGFIEEFSNNCRFIFTCNFKNRIIPPLHSRCAVVDFKIDGKEKAKIAVKYLKRLVYILNQENIEFEQPVLIKLIETHFPDFRRILNEVQRYSVSGKIDTGILLNLHDDNFNKLLSYLKEKNFTETRKWVAHNSDIESTELFSKLYKTSSTNLEVSSIPELVLILAEYQYKAAFVVDAELNTMAALTQVMSRCSFK
jgi:DNA polymerase III delta prime subunit